MFLIHVRCNDQSSVFHSLRSIHSCFGLSLGPQAAPNARPQLGWALWSMQVFNPYVGTMVFLEEHVSFYQLSECFEFWVFFLDPLGIGWFNVFFLVPVLWPKAVCVETMHKQSQTLTGNFPLWDLSPHKCAWFLLSQIFLLCALFNIRNLLRHIFESLAKDGCMIWRNAIYLEFDPFFGNTIKTCASKGPFFGKPHRLEIAHLPPKGVSGTGVKRCSTRTSCGSTARFGFSCAVWL